MDNYQLAKSIYTNALKNGCITLSSDRLHIHIYIEYKEQFHHPDDEETFKRSYADPTSKKTCFPKSYNSTFVEYKNNLGDGRHVELRDKEDQKLVGILLLRKSEAKNLYEIWNVCRILNNERKTRMVAEGLEYLLHHDLSPIRNFTVYLRVEKTNDRAYKLYSQLGFVEDKADKQFYYMYLQRQLSFF